MKRYLLGALALLAALPCLAQEPDPVGKPGEVDFSEVSRWGDRVVVSGEGARDAADILFSMAMAPPEDDSDQWHITVWGHSKDPASLAIVKGFERDANLSPFVATPPSETKRRAWAHFYYVQADDPTQAFRFQQFGIPLAGPFPIITLQPPRNGSFGGLVADQTASGERTSRLVVVDKIEAKNIGQPAELRRRIQASVALWCRKLQQSGFQPPAKVAERALRPLGETERLPSVPAFHAQGPISFPWGPQTPPAQPTINPQWPAGGPATDPPVTPNPNLPPSGILSLLMNLLTGHGTFTDYLLLIGTALTVVLKFRQGRIDKGEKPVIGDALAAILKRLDELLPGGANAAPK